MISITLKGGLGNILFQTCALEYLGKRFGYETCYPNFKEHMNFLDGDFYNYNLHPHELKLIFKNFDWKQGVEPEKTSTIKHIPYAYKDIHGLEDNTHLVGYFQSENFWGGDNEFAKKLFEPSKFLADQLEPYLHLFSGVTCAIHVRRGDYLKFPDVYDPVDVDYINRAKEALKGHGIKKYIVYSDDLDWCREHLPEKNHVFVDPPKDYLVPFLIGQSDYKIIANSSMSWWGAYLSPKGGVVVAPGNWIKDPKINTTFVCPWYWERV